MSDPSPKNAAFCWQELITSDSDKAKTFYADLFNWEARDLEIEGGSTYTIFSHQGDDVAGMIENPGNDNQAPTQWLSYIAVDNLDAIIEQAASLGATLIVPQQAVPNHGRFAVIKDPEGATLAFWEKTEK